MEDFSLSALTALAMANKLLTSTIISTLIALVFIKLYWDKVSYFAMRAWHGFPVIGTVARLARDATTVGKSGWLTSETTLCNNYYDYYKSVGTGGPHYYTQCESYLNTIGESNRRARPAWVLILILALILFEAVGFGYVLGPFVNRDVSANTQSYLAWVIAFMLSIASAVLAEAAGKAIRHNALVSKARHWWEHDNDANKVSPLKQVLPAVGINQTDRDEGEKDYIRILGRLTTNQSVTPARGWIIACVLWVIIIACAAFGVRAYQLKSIESDMIGNPSAFAEQTFESASPFELPGESAALNDQSANQTITDKMDAIRSASLITFIVLSVIFVAIQAVSVWLASIFDFAGNESHKAWETTHKFNSAEQYENWAQNERIKIAAHADHKLGMLQMKLSKRATTNSAVQATLNSANQRNFNAFVELQRQSAHTHATQTPVSAAAAPASPAPVSPVAVVMPAPEATPVLPTPTEAPAIPAAIALNSMTDPLDALRNKDLTAYSDEQLSTICKAKGFDLDAVLALRAEQQLLKDFDTV
ncbi:hypothetical protein [Pseudomonas sp. Marseille-QA0892]